MQFFTLMLSPRSIPSSKSIHILIGMNSLLIYFLEFYDELNWMALLGTDNLLALDSSRWSKYTAHSVTAILKIMTLSMFILVPCEPCYHYGVHTTMGLDWWFHFGNKTCLSHGRIIKKERWCSLTRHPQVARKMWQLQKEKKQTDECKSTPACA